MARTVADAVASARLTLNDVAGVGTGTSELEGYARDALNAIRNERPDLFIGSWGAIAAVTGSAVLPIDDMFFRPIVDYMIGRAQIKDAAHVDSGQAELMVKLMGAFL